MTARFYVLFVLGILAGIALFGVGMYMIYHSINVSLGVILGILSMLMLNCIILCFGSKKITARFAPPE